MTAAAPEVTVDAGADEARPCVVYRDGILCQTPAVASLIVACPGGRQKGICVCDPCRDSIAAGNVKCSHCPPQAVFIIAEVRL